MMSNSEIMEQYNAGKLTRDDANEKLDGVHLTERTPEELEAKRAAEREGEFLDIGRKPERLPARPVMKRDKNKASTSEIQRTKSGRYEVFYDEDGYATKAVRL